MRNKKKCKKKDSNPPIYLNICLNIKIITLAQPDIDFFLNFRLSYFQC